MPLFCTLSAQFGAIYLIKCVCEPVLAAGKLDSLLKYVFSHVISFYRNVCTCFSRRPRLERATSSCLDSKTPAVSCASAEALSAICNISSFQNTSVGKEKKQKRPRLWLRSLSLSFSTPTHFQHQLCSVSRTGWPCFSRPTPSALARQTCGEAPPSRHGTSGC